MSKKSDEITNLFETMFHRQEETFKKMTDMFKESSEMFSKFRDIFNSTSLLDVFPEEKKEEETKTEDKKPEETPKKDTCCETCCNKVKVEEKVEPKKEETKSPSCYRTCEDSPCSKDDDTEDATYTLEVSDHIARIDQLTQRVVRKIKELNYEPIKNRTRYGWRYELGLDRYPIYCPSRSRGVTERINNQYRNDDIRSFKAFVVLSAILQNTKSACDIVFNTISSGTQAIPYALRTIGDSYNRDELVGLCRKVTDELNLLLETVTWRNDTTMRSSISSRHQIIRGNERTLQVTLRVNGKKHDYEFNVDNDKYFLNLLTHDGDKEKEIEITADTKVKDVLKEIL